MRNAPATLLCLLLAFSILLSGCTTPAVPSPGTSPAGRTVAQATANPAAGGLVKQVKIIQRSFDPDIVTVTPGTTVIWTNEDTVSHRVVHLPDTLGAARTELFHSGPLYPGDSFSYTFSSPGEYAYGDPQYGSGRHSLVIVK